MLLEGYAFSDLQPGCGSWGMLQVAGNFNNVNSLKKMDYAHLLLKDYFSTKDTGKKKKKKKHPTTIGKSLEAFLWKNTPLLIL